MNVKLTLYLSRGVLENYFSTKCNPIYTPLPIIALSKTLDYIAHRITIFSSSGQLGVSCCMIMMIVVLLLSFLFQ